MKPYIAVFLLCFAINIFAQPNDGSANNQQKTTSQTPPKQAVTIENNKPESSQHTDTTDDGSCWFYAAFKRPEWWGVLVAAIAAGVVAWQAKEMRCATDVMKTANALSQKNLVLAQRAKIDVSAFYFAEVRGTLGNHKGIQYGSMASGQFYIRNCGGTQATIQEIYCSVYISKSLPMKRPYEGDEGSKETKILQPGQSTFYLFGLMQPLLGPDVDDIRNKKKNFYVLGWIGYTDDLGIYRIRAFCRWYDVEIDRFVPVGDPDYEYAD